MRAIARLLAPLTCAAALGVVPATPAHAGCVDDLLARFRYSIEVNPDPSRYAEIVGGDVIVHTDTIVSDGVSAVFFVYTVGVIVVFNSADAVIAFAGCVG